ncbi:hypothetical protein A943_20345 [Bacillus sp. CPSM8]|nr:hypothetical protein BLMD_12630 [Bacillus paralicheniformis]ETB69655.1 hypothetical protein A943_20345 [Bacillus sp. CPSM8]KND06853.1 hypothetical protein ACJ43_13600 [Bacillus paralicheniformis]OPF71000.1 hypothetical protein BVF99_18415 [Bacillus paralicheniformis]
MKDERGFKEKKRSIFLQVKCPPGIVSHRSFIIHDFHRRFNLFLKSFTKVMQERRLFQVDWLCASLI